MSVHGNLTFCELRPASLEVIEKHGNRRRNENGEGYEAAGQRPIEPYPTAGLRAFIVEPAEKRGPQIPGWFWVCHARQRLLEQLLHAVFIVCIHGVIPCCSKSFLSKRKTRTLTAATEMPSASATCLCGSSSTIARMAAIRNLGGSLRKASAVLVRI